MPMNSGRSTSGRWLSIVARKAEKRHGPSQRRIGTENGVDWALSSDSCGMGRALVDRIKLHFVPRPHHLSSALALMSQLPRRSVDVAAIEAEIAAVVGRQDSRCPEVDRLAIVGGAESALTSPLSRTDAP